MQEEEQGARQERSLGHRPAWIIIALWANAEFRIILSEKGATGEFETGQRHTCTCSIFFLPAI